MADTPHKDSSTQGQFLKVFDAERDAIRQRRAHNGVRTGGDALDLPDFADLKTGDVSKLLENTLAELDTPEARTNWKAARTVEDVETGLLGVSLSGGGIRSSTFNLGVLQAIHRAGLFRYVDYLSTVSGGGYIGTYLTTWISAEALKAEPPKDPFPFVHHMGVEEGPCFRHLRNHANYLAPERQVELLSIPLVLLRGLFVNALVILPYLMAIALLLAGLMDGLGTGNEAYKTHLRLWSAESPSPWKYFLFTGGFLGLLLTMFFLYPIMHTVRTSFLGRTDSDVEATRAFMMRVLRAPLIAALVCFFVELQPLVLQWLGTPTWPGTLAVLGAMSAVLPFANKIINQFSDLLAKAAATLLGIAGVACLWLLLLRLTLAAEVDWGTFSLVPLAFNKALIWGVGIPVLWIYGCFFVDVNALSVHKFYRDRLVTAFVVRVPARGSANRDQGPKPRQQADVPRLSAIDTKTGPYHLINAAVNVRRVDEEAAYKNGRRAGFFFFAPRYCGGIRTGYIRTADLEHAERNLDIGTAMAISGAAIAPNMGKFTNRWLAFTIAMLNVRLNYWLANPRKLKDPSGLLKLVPPALTALSNWLGGVGPLYLFREMLQQLDAGDKYVNLSDGGHIENLGVYELLRRQCRLIIAGDGEADPTLAFQGLAEVIRLARIDFGFDIQMQGLDEMRSGEQMWAVGTIHYSSTRTGKLIYIKSNLGGDYNLQATLAPDMYRSSSARDDNLLFDDNPYIAYYRQGNPDFPQESTADQSFDELQFESYRALGYQVAASVLLAPPR